MSFFLIIGIHSLYSLIMNIKLFAIMGGSWIMESISWFFAGKMHQAFWIIFDMFNVLRGLWLLIFCVFLSKRVRRALLRKCNFMSGIKTPSASNRNTVNVSLSKGSQSDQSDKVEMKALVRDSVFDPSLRNIYTAQ
jgi:hypothetical protein